ncbi:hypothetical protein PtA15_1A565 [Puccinia triticina]|nr:uncharacterized protein PtA15_1A565 [Puccinia triticina]WAQ81225.1 hypothetical protein PtA15_1A565 [Puccinia triticina]
MRPSTLNTTLSPPVPSFSATGPPPICQDINGIKFVCAGSCVARTACLICEYDNVTKTKAFRPPWEPEMCISPLLIAESNATPIRLSFWMISMVVFVNLM